MVCGLGHLSHVQGLGVLVAAALILLAQLPPAVIAARSAQSAAQPASHPGRGSPRKSASKKSGRSGDLERYGFPPTWSPPNSEADAAPPAHNTAKTARTGKTAGGKTAKSALTPGRAGDGAGDGDTAAPNTKTAKSMGMGKSAQVHTAKRAKPTAEPTTQPTAEPTAEPTAKPTPTTDEVLAAMGWGDLTTRSPRTPEVPPVAATGRPVGPEPIDSAHPANTSNALGAGADGAEDSDGADEATRVDADLSASGGDDTGTSRGGPFSEVGAQTMIWAGAAFGVALVGVLLLGIRRVVGRRHTVAVGKGGGAAAKKAKKKVIRAKSLGDSAEKTVGTARALPSVPTDAALPDDYAMASMPDDPDYAAPASPTVADLDVDYAEPDLPEDPEHEMWCVPQRQTVDYRAPQGDATAALGVGRAIAAAEEPLYMEPEPIDGGLYDGNRTLQIRNAYSEDPGTESPDGDDQWHC